MSALVQPANASIATFSVTVRALHVDNKQMTLAVFRQLPVQSIYEFDGTIWRKAQLWGVVRYDVPGEGKRWAVASHNNVLYRCLIDEQWDGETDFVGSNQNTLGRNRRIANEQLLELPQLFIAL